MLDIFLLIVTIITSVICVIVDIYIMAIYSHRDEAVITPINIICKILIVFTLFQIQIQPILMIFDIINARTVGPDLTIMWVIIYFMILGNIAVIKPLATSIYDRDQDDACWKQILWIIFQFIITIAVYGLMLGLGWLFWGFISIEVNTVSQNVVNQGVQNVGNVIAEIDYIDVQITLPCFLIGMLCLIGYPIVVCCGACGMTALPLSLIMQFVNRPKRWLRTKDAKKITQALQQQTIRLIKEADQVKRSVTRMDYVDGWLAKRKKNNQIQENLQKIQQQLEKHAQYYELFQLQMKMADVNPLVYVGKLILGIICFIATLLLWVQILLSQLVFQGTGKVFLDSLFILLQLYGANFAAIAFLMLTIVFLTCSMIKGAFFVSNNIPFITIHPMIPYKTWLNSFLFQLTLCLLGSCALMHLLLNSFPQYLRGGQIQLMMGEVLNGMLLIGVFMKHRVFAYAFIVIFFFTQVMTGVGALFVVLRIFCCNSQNDNQISKMIEQKRQKIFGKKDKDKPMIVQIEKSADKKSKGKYSKKSKKPMIIQMTEMNLGQRQNRTPKK